MNLALPLIPERFLTVRALVRPRVSVHVFMLLQNFSPQEFLLTVLALVRLLSRVLPAVHCQLTLSRVADSAHIADKWFLPGVYPPVLLHVASLREALPTELTGEWTVARVEPQVALQVCLLGKPLATHFTAVGVALLTGPVDPLVVDQFGLALEFFFTLVT